MQKLSEELLRIKVHEYALLWSGAASVLINKSRWANILMRIGSLEYEIESEREMQRKLSQVNADLVRQLHIEEESHG